MKKIFFALVALSLVSCTFGQKDLVSSIFEKYSGTDGITTVNITGDMLKLITQAEQERRDTVLNSKLSEIRILSLESNCDKPVDLDLRRDIYDKLDKSQYKEMMSVKQQDEDVVILLKEVNGRIAEILIIAGGKNDNALIQIKGDMLLSEIADMAGKYQMKGMEKLKMLEN
jgi:hypothetical protein